MRRALENTMNVTVTAKTDFVHGNWNLQRGHEGGMPLSVARDLRAAGLIHFEEPAVEIHSAPDNAMRAQPENGAPSAPTNQMAPTPASNPAPAPETKTRRPMENKVKAKP
jgi:hypothetical protein